MRHPGTAPLSSSGQPGAPHSALNTGNAPAQLVVTYVVEAGKPLSTPIP